MPTERPDHFAHLREPVSQEVPEGAPVIRPDIITWLEAQFPIVVPEPPRSLDEAAAGISDLAALFGQQQVIAHLRLLVRQG